MSRWGTGWPIWLWGLGTALGVGRIVWSHVLTSILGRHQELSTDAGVTRTIRDLARPLALHRQVRIFQATGLTAPVACGVIRPKILLPSTFESDFRPDERDVILTHELAHLAAWDPAWHLISELVCAALWWHPFSWWIRRRLLSACENAADEASLLVPDGANLLADCLVALGRRISRPASVGGLSFAGTRMRSGLGRRVMRLLSLRNQVWRPPRDGHLLIARAVLPVTLVVIVVLCTAWVRPRGALAIGDIKMNVVRSSWSRSLAATALFALVGSGSGQILADDELNEETVRLLDGFELFLAAGDDEGERDDSLLDETDDEGERPQRERDEWNEDVFALERQREELAERAHDIQRELEELGDEREELGNEREKDVRQLRKELREILEKLRSVESLLQRHDRSNQEQHRRLLQVRRAVRTLQSAGRHEEAEEVQRAAERLERIMQKQSEHDELRSRMMRGRRFEPEEGERQLEHIRIAAENLRAAGLDDLAEELQHEAERRLMRSPEREPRRHREPDHVEHLERAVHDLHEQMQQMQHEMEKMHRHLERLIHRDQEDDEEEDPSFRSR